MIEREKFIECMRSPQSAALRHMFFAEREAAKVRDVPKDTPLREVSKVGVIGAGTMGSGIAMNFANVGIPVTIVERDQASLDRGLGVEVMRAEHHVRLAAGELAVPLGEESSGTTGQHGAECRITAEAEEQLGTGRIQHERDLLGDEVALDPRVRSLLGHGGGHLRDAFGDSGRRDDLHAPDVGLVEDLR